LNRTLLIVLAVITGSPTETQSMKLDVTSATVRKCARAHHLRDFQSVNGEGDGHATRKHALLLLWSLLQALERDMPKREDGS
jgi:hypothetical protein